MSAIIKRIFDMKIETRIEYRKVVIRTEDLKIKKGTQPLHNLNGHTFMRILRFNIHILLKLH